MTWWLSFADEAGFKGAVIVPDVEEFLAAVLLTHALGLNPGGECVGFPMPTPEEDPEAYAAFVSYPHLTLLTRADLTSHGPCVNIHGEPVQ